MKRFYRGVTLLELLCVMVCLSVLVGLAVGSWFYYRAHVRRDAVIAEVSHAITIARAEAMARQTVVVYCGSRDLQHCDGQWDRGQIIRYLHKDQVVRAYPPVWGVRLAFHANFGRSDRILFSADGFTLGQNGHFDVCVADRLSSKPCRSLVLHFSGQTVG